MKRLLIAAFAATTMLVCVGDANADLLPTNRYLGEVNDNELVDFTIVEDDPAVNDITVGMDPGLGLVADYENGSIRIHGTLLSRQPWGPRAFSIISFDSNGNLINVATYQITA